MCIIIWSPGGTIPKDEVVSAMARHPHGWGFTVRSGGKLHTYKGVDAKQFLTAWVNRRKGPVLFHARWATHGPVVGENCHPFAVSGHNMVAAHNGVLRGYGSRSRSDTRDFLAKVVEPLPEWFSEEATILNALERSIGTSKIVLLTPHSTVILNESLGVWQGGRWYSNTTIFAAEPTVCELDEVEYR